MRGLVQPRVSRASHTERRLVYARALLAASPLDHAISAMAFALLLAWLIALLTPVGFAPDTTAEWIMARTPADLANALLDRLGNFARPTALLGGYACYLVLAIGVGGIQVAGGWMRRAKKRRNLTPDPSPAKLERGAYALAELPASRVVTTWHPR